MDRSVGVNLAEELTGTTRFKIPRTRLPDGYKWVNGRLTKIQRREDQTAIGLKHGHTYPRNNKGKLQNGRNKVPNCIHHAATGESYRPMTKISSR